MPFLDLDPSVFTFILPFVFILAIVYGALHMSGVIKNKGANGLIAIVIGLFGATNPDMVVFTNQIIPLAIPFFILFFFVGFIISFFRKQKAEKDYPLLVIIFGLVLIFLLFVQSETQLFSETLVTAAAVIFMLLLLFAAYKASKEEK